VYVSPAGVAGAVDWSCGSAAFSSIQAAVEAAPSHGTVVVCPGVYQTSVTVDRPAHRRYQSHSRRADPYGYGHHGMVER
jgi:hypothetical protein